MVNSEQKIRQLIIENIQSGNTRLAAELADGLKSTEFKDLIALSDCENILMYGSPSEKKCVLEIAKSLEKSLHEKYNIERLYYQ